MKESTELPESLKSFDVFENTKRGYFRRVFESMIRRSLSLDSNAPVSSADVDKAINGRFVIEYCLEGQDKSALLSNDKEKLERVVGAFLNDQLNAEALSAPLWSNTMSYGSMNRDHEINEEADTEKERIKLVEAHRRFKEIFFELFGMLVGNFVSP